MTETNKDQTFPSAIDLTVRGAPSGAEVWLEEESLGSASRPVSLPYTVTPMEVTVRSAGYESATVTVIPDRPREIVVNLKRLVGGAPGAPPDSHP